MKRIDKNFKSIDSELGYWYRVFNVFNTQEDRQYLAEDRNEILVNSVTKHFGALTHYIIGTAMQYWPGLNYKSSYLTNDGEYWSKEINFPRVNFLVFSFLMEDFKCGDHEDLFALSLACYLKIRDNHADKRAKINKILEDYALLEETDGNFADADDGVKIKVARRCSYLIHAFKSVPVKFREFRRKDFDLNSFMEEATVFDIFLFVVHLCSDEKNPFKEFTIGQSDLSGYGHLNYLSSRLEWFIDHFYDIDDKRTTLLQKAAETLKYDISRMTEFKI